MTRITQHQLESYLWGAAVLLRGTIDAGDYKQFIFPLLFFKRLCDVFNEEIISALRDSGGDQDFALFPENHRFQIPSEGHWQEIRKVNRDVGQAIQHAMRSIEVANQDKLMGIFGDAQWTNKERLSDAMLRDLIEHFSTLELTLSNLPEDELGQGYEYLIKKFADDSGHTAAEFYTNRTVVHLMTEMLDVQPGESVYDPTCGSGGMLLSCISHLRKAGKEWRNVKLFGQERNLMTSSIARMNCFLHGIEDFQIERGDTLAEPKLVEGDHLKRFDVVLANPPYSIKQWNREAFASDPWGRNVFGVPPQGRADYAFQQHILQSLKPQSGRCAVLWPHGVLFRQEESEMRQKLIESDLIDCVLGLGPNLFYNSPMEACVLICRTQKPSVRRGKILFINAVNEVTREGGQSFLTEAQLHRVVHAYHNFKDEPGFATVSTLDDVRSKKGNLSIPLYVQAETVLQKAEAANLATNALPQDLTDFIDNSIKFRNSLGRLNEFSAFKFTVPKDSVAANPKWGELSLFNRSTWERVRFGDVANNPSVSVTDRNTLGIEKIISLDNIDSDSLSIRRSEQFDSNPSFKTYFKKGQTLFGKRRAYLRKVAVAECNGVCTQNILVFETSNPQRMLPEFLPFLCRSERFLDYAIATSKGSLFPNADWRHISKFEFYLPSLDQQRRIIKVLQSLNGIINDHETLQGTLKQACKNFFNTTVEHGRNLASSEECKSWREVPLSEVVDFLDRQRKPIKESERSKRRGDYPYYGASGVIDTIDDFIFDEPLLLLGEDGANIVDRSSPLAFRVDGKIWVNNHAHVLRVKKPNSLIYVEYYLESLDYKPFVTGTAQPKLNKGVCESILMPIPDSNLQVEIERHLLAFEDAQEAQAKSAKQAKQLLSALLNQFIGTCT